MTNYKEKLQRQFYFMEKTRLRIGNEKVLIQDVISYKLIKIYDLIAVKKRLQIVIILLVSSCICKINRYNSRHWFLFNNFFLYQTEYYKKKYKEQVMAF